jgi:hypothetical protein
LQPRPANNTAVSPVPQPASRTVPVIRSVTSMKGFYGLPMSQGGWQAYLFSNVLWSWIMGDSPDGQAMPILSSWAR